MLFRKRLESWVTWKEFSFLKIVSSKLCHIIIVSSEKKMCSDFIFTKLQRIWKPSNLSVRLTDKKMPNIAMWFYAGPIKKIGRTDKNLMFFTFSEIVYSFVNYYRFLYLFSYIRKYIKASIIYECEYVTMPILYYIQTSFWKVSNWNYASTSTMICTISFVLWNVSYLLTFDLLFNPLDMIWFINRILFRPLSK